MLCLTMSDCLSDFLFFKQKTAYEMRISDWSSDVCSSDLPDAVPAGKYAKAALTALGVWSSVADRLAPAENVRAAMALVERGAAPLGIVYATEDRKSVGEGKRLSVSEELGGQRIIKQKNITHHVSHSITTPLLNPTI